MSQWLFLMAASRSSNKSTPSRSVRSSPINIAATLACPADTAMSSNPSIWESGPETDMSILTHSACPSPTAKTLRQSRVCLGRRARANPARYVKFFLILVAVERMGACHVRLLDETDKEELHATKRH